MLLVMCMPSVALCLNESHELQELTCNCHQTKSSLSVRKKGVFWGTLEWILLPWRETNWARQASLQEWLKLVCSSASAPPNKEKKPPRECGRRGKRQKRTVGENESKGAWLDHGALMVPDCGAFFSAVTPQQGKSGRARVNREDAHTDCCNVGRNGCIPTGNFLGDNPQTWSHWKPHAAQGWKDWIRRDWIVCATYWDNKGCIWHSAVRSKMELPSTSCYGWWGAHLAPTGVLNLFLADDKGDVQDNQGHF